MTFTFVSGVISLTPTTDNAAIILSSEPLAISKSTLRVSAVTTEGYSNAVIFSDWISIPTICLTAEICNCSDGVFEI